MIESEIKIGRRIRTKVDWSGVPAGSHGYIIEDYKSGITVAWDLPNHPYPMAYMPEEVAKMTLAWPECPLRDRFNKERELHHLEVIS